MRKNELRKISFLDNDDQEKEIYLNELEESLQNYIKTGVKNQQLDELLIYENEFQARYRQRFDIDRILGKIKETSRDMVQPKSYLIVDEGKERIGLDDDHFNQLLMKASEDIISLMVQNINEMLPQILKDAAYLSHMNMLYELYEKEEQLRREQKEFEKISTKFKSLAEITKSLSEQRRMKLDEIENKVKISSDEIIIIINQCNQYFNIRENNEEILVSLSVFGKKYNDYIRNVNTLYSTEIMNQLLYKNCDNILASLEKSFICSRVVELKLEGILPEEERIIKHKYFNTLHDIMEDDEYIYKVPKKYFKEKKEDVNDGDEENRIRIPTGWNKGGYSVI